MSSEAERKSRSQPRGGGLVAAAAARRLAAVRLVVLHGTALALVAVYALAGACTFMQIEGAAEEARSGGGGGDERQSAERLLLAAKTQLLGVVRRKGQGSVDAENWSALVDEALSAFEKAVESAVKQGAQDDAAGGAAASAAAKWDFWGSLFYVNTIYTTIGYGNTAPSTTAGRAATIVYATFGIPLFLVLQANLGGLVVSAIKKLLRSLVRLSPKPKRTCDHDTEEEQWPRETDIESLQGLAVLVIVVVISTCYIGLGACLCRSWEDWTPLEAFYFVFISLTTIGFGDIVPSLRPKHFALSSLYVFVGLTLVATTLTAIQGMMASRVDAVKAKADYIFGVAAADKKPAEQRITSTDTRS